MRFWVSFVVAMVAAFPMMIWAEDDDDVSHLIDDKKLDGYIDEIDKYRKDGKSWKEIEDLMGIWWPEDDERAFPERFQPSGRQGSTDQDKVNEMVNLLYKRLAQDTYRLEHHPGGAKATKYTIPIIRYVANLDDNALLNLDDSDE